MGEQQQMQHRKAMLQVHEMQAIGCLWIGKLQRIKDTGTGKELPLSTSTPERT